MSINTTHLLFLFLLQPSVLAEKVRILALSYAGVIPIHHGSSETSPKPYIFTVRPWVMFSAGWGLYHSRCMLGEA
jgi:hypothetical protein